MPAYPLAAASAAFADAVAALLELAEGLDDATLLGASRCRGWTVSDVLCHVHLGLQEMMVGFASPTTDPADGDFLRYWGREAAGRDEPTGQIRFTRLLAAAYARPSTLVRHLAPTARATARLAAAADAGVRVAFQGQVLPVGDFVATWAVELAVHHLDLLADLPDAAGPPASALRVARETVDGLVLAHGGDPSTTVGWDDTQYLLAATGRRELPPPWRAALGPVAHRFPLLG